jgi:hypothetical protein
MKYIPINTVYAVNPDTIIEISTTLKYGAELVPIPGEKHANWLNVTVRSGEWKSSEFMSLADVTALRDEIVAARTSAALPCEVDGVPL